MTALAALSADVCRPIQGLILDVDGVLTDGGIVYASHETEILRFHVRDGAGIQYWQRAGHTSAILSGRGSPMLTRRAAELGIATVRMHAKEKLPALHSILEETGLAPAACCYVGDDLPDLPPMRAVGLAVAVGDAVPEVRAAAHAVTERPGGYGAVREVVEHLLRAQGRWEGILARYEETPA